MTKMEDFRRGQFGLCRTNDHRPCGRQGPPCHIAELHPAVPLVRGMSMDERHVGTNRVTKNRERLRKSSNAESRLS